MLSNRKKFIVNFNKIDLIKDLIVTILFNFINFPKSNFDNFHNFSFTFVLFHITLF